MLLKHRPPGIEPGPVPLRSGLEHLAQNSVAVLRWLNANKVDYVVVGPLARAIRGDRDATGPVAIVPAPYGRNFDRLALALVAERAGLRADGSDPSPTSASDAAATSAAPVSERTGAVAVKLTAEKLARGKRWMLRFGAYDLDVEAVGARAQTAAGEGAAAAPGYQELLYEAGRFELADGLTVEVASPEDLEHYSHVRRTGTTPEFRVTRRVQAEQESA